MLRWPARKTDLKRTLLLALLLMASEAGFTQNSEKQCIAEWAVVSLEVDAAPARVDFSNPSTIVEAKRVCDLSRLKKIAFWPQSLRIQFLLCQGEVEHLLGHYEDARHYFDQVISEGSKSLAARASYRLAEIAEQKIWALPFQGKTLRSPQLAHQEIMTFLTGVREARDAFMKVSAFDDHFWARRAAFRVISIVDDALWEIRTNIYVANLQGRSSPFDFLFGHFVESRFLDEQLFALEQERELLEQTLLTQLTGSKDDPVLVEALLGRIQDQLAQSPSFTEFIKAPWVDDITTLPVIRVQERYYQPNANQSVKPLSKGEALRRIRRALADPSKPMDFAFALAYLTDEGEPAPEAVIRFALEHENTAVQIAGLYAAESFASHSLTPTLIGIWKKTVHQNVAPHSFLKLQNTLFGKPERMLLCLARHFSLGRHSTQMILASKDIGDAEKAWLLQFRRDRSSNEVASKFLNHRDPIVRLRAHYAMRMWNRRSENEV